MTDDLVLLHIRSTEQPQAPNEVKSTRVQNPHPRYLGFIFVQREEEEMSSPPSYAVCDKNLPVWIKTK